MRPGARAASGARGFTLIEVMIAMAIMAGLTGIVWVSVSQMFQTRDAVDARFERYQLVRLAMNRMANEIAMAYVAGPQHGGEIVPGEEALYESEEEQLSMQLREPVQFGMIGGEDEISFTAFAHVRVLEDERASHHTQIGYEVRREINEAGDVVNRLVRRSHANYVDDITRGGVVHTMIPEVESLEFEYWDPGPVDIGSEREIAQGRWVSEWDTTRREHAGRLPTRVRITLVMPAQGPRGESEVFTTQTTLGMTELLEY
ncbi:hypothetical protein DL240_07960 [Lujinxingia litoralis]|uniref:Type II secretion system protein J n=1 Tax=Lujinxingia litoralis TaxID=2211119 RepID=A0A328CC68_9DELT|nr:type II secretion system protein GspJ [Lujinxingia litoralis]RAL23137.1 hypothetical protein DL240_07960 [Lujinxingia litoralis]